MRYFICLCCLSAIVCLSLPAFAMNLTDFESRCSMGLQMGNDNMCGSTNDICGSFMDELAKAKDKASCKQSCSDSEAALRPRHITDGCGQTVQHAYSECTIYCETLE